MFLRKVCNNKLMIDIGIGMVPQSPDSMCIHLEYPIISGKEKKYTVQLCYLQKLSEETSTEKELQHYINIFDYNMNTIILDLQRDLNLFSGIN